MRCYDVTKWWEPAPEVEQPAVKTSAAAAALQQHLQRAKQSKQRAVPLFEPQLSSGVAVASASSGKGTALSVFSSFKQNREHWAWHYAAHVHQQTHVKAQVKPVHNVV